MRTSLLLASIPLIAAAQTDQPAATPPRPAEVRPVPPLFAATPNEQALVHYYAAVTEGKPDIVSALFVEDFRSDVALPGVKPGRDGFRDFLALVRTAFPDASFVPVEFVSQGETTVCRYRFTGTHRARFLNLRPTRKVAAVTGIDVWKFRDGKIAELHGNFDALGLLVQLGLVPEIK